MAKSKKPTADLKDVVFVKDEPRKPIRVLTQKQTLKRFQVSRPCYLKYEKAGEVQARAPSAARQSTSSTRSRSAS